MIEFSKQISEKWNIPAALSEKICVAFERHDTPFYLVEYVPEIAVELSTSTVWEIYDFLDTMEELSAKKKRVLNALKKAEKTSSSIEKRVNLIANPYELDDLLIPLRPNPRSKGQLASKKGLDPLADIIMKQTEERCSIEELAEPYVGKEPSLGTVADVIQGVKDLLAEKFAYDETVRTMTREFAYDDGFLDVVPKNRKDPLFIQYIGKNVPIQECSKEEILKLMVAEDQKNIRLKLGVQLFRITELIRHHFIENPDSCGFDLICESIDDAWLRLLQPVIERDVKMRMREEAEEWASKKIVSDLYRMYIGELNRGPILIADAAQDKNIFLIAISGKGELLGATTERKPPEGKTYFSDRLRQFINRHKPGTILLLDNDQASIAESVIKQAIGNTIEPQPSITRFVPENSQTNPGESEWIKKEFATLLDPEMFKLYGFALQYLKPISLLPKIGCQYYQVHEFQLLLTETKFIEILNRIITEFSLKSGVVIKDILDSPLSKFKIITSEILQDIRSFDSKTPIGSKNELLKVPGINETIFRNIAGFVIIPNADELIDRTVVHPEHFALIDEISEQLTISVDTIINDPEIICSFNTDDNIIKVYIDKYLADHVQVGQKYLSQQSSKSKRKLKLNELKEGAIISGRVTNITPFGVFININAVCDGLIHISQLADEYVETPDQVVGINDKVDVKILKVDVKKRRISLSMKNLGNKAPKVRPSKGQLDHLAEHFKNR